MQLFENVARVPMLIATPGFGKDKITKSPAELIDIYPTLAELTGLTPPKNLQGKSLVKILKQPDLAIETPSYTQVDKKVKQKGEGKYSETNYLGRSVRYRQWRYTEWNGGKDGAELYNYDNDPKEFNNLVNNPDYAKIIVMLQEQLHKVYK
jgi:arylsulfatase A-like enzyme